MCNSPLNISSLGHHKAFKKRLKRLKKLIVAVGSTVIFQVYVINVIDKMLDAWWKKNLMSTLPKGQVSSTYIVIILSVLVSALLFLFLNLRHTAKSFTKAAVINYCKYIFHNHNDAIKCNTLK